MTEKAISALAAALDRALVGQEDAKTGVLLALLAREHAYLEGPPGVGKSRLAEAAVHAASGSPTLLALHRDTQLQDLVGPVQLRREPHGEGQRLALPAALAEDAEQRTQRLRWGPIEIIQQHQLRP